MLDAPLVDDEQIALLLMLFARGNVVALTGAGISTESGIPDYRGPLTRQKLRQPMRGRTFRQSSDARRRYWARSLRGWPHIRDATPNPAHHALAALEARGVVSAVITQNVDGLHQRAGAHRVHELHGALSRVRCLTCDRVHSRDEVQGWLEVHNPHTSHASLAPAPDGDVDLPDEDRFVVPGCPACGGVIKPDVVFFGENADPAVVAGAYQAVDRADALLVVGSSLEVYSARRFVLRAAERGLATAVVNLGPTRMDDFATLLVDGRAGDVLPRLAAACLGPPAPAPRRA